MIIVGWIVSIIGVITCIVSLGERNDAISSYYGYGRYYNSGGVDDAELAIAIGIVIVVIGILILLAGYIKKGSKNGEKKDSVNLLYTKKCLKCGSIVKQDAMYCPNCGNDLINQNIAKKESGEL